MRQLLLFRHAEAVHSSKFGDRERPLTAAGRLAAARVGAFLAATRQNIDLVLISDSQRTRESWDVARAEYGAAPDVQFVKKLYQAERRDLLDLARELPDSVEAAMILGHNPAVSEFAARFAGSGDRDALARLERGFPPAGLAIFDADVDEWRKLRWGGGALTHFMT